MRKRVVFLPVACLAIAAVIAWSLARWPRPALILRHGSPSSDGVDYRERVVGGVGFVEIPAGYVWFEPRSEVVSRGDVLGRVSRWLDVRVGRRSIIWREDRSPYWAESSEAFWITREYYREAVYEDQLRALKRVAAGSFSIPTRAQWDFAYACGLGVDREGEFELTQDGLVPLDLYRPAADFPPSSVRDGPWPPCTVVRLVWIPE